MKNKKGKVFTDYIVWIILAVVVLGIAFLIMSQEKSFLSGVASTIKSKLGFRV